MLKGHIFNKQTFESHIWALASHVFANSLDGVFMNYKNSMGLSYSGHTVTVNSGACIVQGRILEEDSSTTLDAGIETMFCILAVEIDLTKTNTSSNFMQGSYKIIRSSSGFPSLSKQDIVANVTGVYQFEIARFKVSEGNITDFEDKRVSVQDNMKIGERNLDSSKAPNNHASNDGIYGLGDATYYGHTKVIDNCNISQSYPGHALNAHQGYILNEKIDNRCNSITATMQEIEQRVSALERK